MTPPEFSKCHVCRSYLGCAVNCLDAPWNWDLPRTTPRGYLKRLVKWICATSKYELPLPFRPDLRWL